MCERLKKYQFILCDVVILGYFADGIYQMIFLSVFGGVIYGLTYIPALLNALIAVQLPAMTDICIGALCVFNNLLMRTRQKQDMRAAAPFSRFK